MCGIIGFIGKVHGNEMVLNGLRHLEYRGYDSLGMVVNTLSELIVKKDVGKVEEVSKKLNFMIPEGNLILGHTRWATHGNVTPNNAHPHLDCSKNIAVVHNGIIENYLELKNMLIKKGHKFSSETDTEVVPHLIEEEIKNGKNLEEAVFSLFNYLKGTFALAITKVGEEKIIGVKKGSPLVLGISDYGYFIGSDIPAFLNYTKNVVYIKDNEVIIATKNNFKIYQVKENGEIEEVEKKIYVIDWDPDKVERGEFDHFMIKEILEQKDTIKLASIQELSKIEKFCEAIKNSKKVFFVAAGSSYHASICGTYLFSKIANIASIPILASEFPYYKNLIDRDSLIIAISQSGETYDVLEAVKIAKSRGAKVYSIVNVNGSTLTWESDEYLLMNVGPEIGVAATKTYTAELVILLLLSYYLSNKFDEGKKRIEYLENIIYNLTAESSREEIKKIAKKLKNVEHVFFIGRGMLYPIVMEGALKMKEISYIHAEAFAGGELKHGTLALIENGTPCIVLVDEETREEILSNAEEVKARGGIIIGVSPKRERIFDYWIKVPDCGYENVICFVIPLQILAYYLAVLRGNNPDRPRNLAKSVTVK